MIFTNKGMRSFSASWNLFGVLILILQNGETCRIVPELLICKDSLSTYSTQVNLYWLDHIRSLKLWQERGFQMFLQAWGCWVDHHSTTLPPQGTERNLIFGNWDLNFLHWVMSLCPCLLAVEEKIWPNLAWIYLDSSTVCSGSFHTGKDVNV